MKYLFKIIDYLKQVSTWRGLIAIATVCGVVLSDAKAEAIIAAGVALIGLIEVFRNEKH